ARVLVLELHAGGAISVSLGKGRHSVGFDEFRYRRRLGAEAFALIPLGAMAQSEMQRGEAAHREPHDMRAVDAQMVEHRGNVVGGTRLRIGTRALGHIGGRIAPGVEGNAAITLAEMTELRLPAPEIAGEFVDEDDWRSVAGLLVVKADSVIRPGLWHAFLPWLLYCRPAITSSVARQFSSLADLSAGCSAARLASQSWRPAMAMAISGSMPVSATVAADSRISAARRRPCSMTRPSQ